MPAPAPRRTTALYRPRVLALALACLAHPLAQAAADAAAPQDLTALPFEQLLTMEVYSASRFVQKASEAPASVTVISAADIRNFGWRTLADVARSVRGLYVSYDRNYSYLGARGFLRPGDYNTRFLLQVDGNRINDTVYDQAPAGGEFPLELDLIERIEFVPGPGSSIYGSNAFFGVINVITKKPGALGGARVALEGGQFGMGKASASTSWRDARGTSFMLAASRYSSAGEDQYYAEFDTPASNFGVAQHLDYERGARMYANGTNGPLGLTLMYADRVKGIPTASFRQPFNDPRPRTNDRQAYLNLAYGDKLGASEDLTARLFWGSYDSFGDYVNDDEVRSLNHDGSNARWWGTEVKLVSTRFAGHRLVAGFDYQRDYSLRQYTYDVDPYKQYLDERRSATRAGLYVQDQVSLSENLLLNLGLRHDRNSGAGAVSSPRLALIHQLSAATTLKAIYGTAYRAPNSYEMHYAFPGDGGQLPNPQLRNERIVSSELVLVRQFDSGARLTVTAFRNVVSRLISQVLDPASGLTRFENADRASARGVELEYERRWANGATLRTSYSHSQVARLDQAPQAQSEIGIAARPLTLDEAEPAQINAPRHLAKFNGAAPLGWSGWHAGLEAQYVGPRITRSGRTAGFWLANANLYSAQLVKNVEVALGLFNLFDTNYADPGSTEHAQRAIRQDGRSVRLKLSYAF